MAVKISRQDIPGLVISAIIGLALTIGGSIRLKNASDSKSWPVVTGIITGSQVGGGIKYYPSVSYSYIVDGVEYSSNRISDMNFNTKNRSVAEDVIKKYPLDAEVKVYYDSEDPSKAYLEPGIISGNFLLLGFGLLILAIPVVTVILAIFRSGTK